MNKAVIIRLLTLFTVVAGYTLTVKCTNGLTTIQNKNSHAVNNSIKQLETGILAVPEVYYNRDTYVEKKIQVRGRILAQPHYSAGPCAHSKLCPPIIDITLHLVNPVSVDQHPTVSLDLFEQTAEDTFVPMTCSFIIKENFDCHPFTQNELITVEGTFIKHKIPYQTFGTSDGILKVLKYIDVYIFVIGAEHLKNTNPCGFGQTPVYERKGISICADIPETEK